MFKMCSGVFVLNRIMESNSLLGPWDFFLKEMLG